MKIMFEAEVPDLSQSSLQAALNQIKGQMLKVCPIGETVKPASVEMTVVAIEPTVVSGPGELTNTQCIDWVFTKIRKTDKSQTIVDALIDSEDAIAIKDLATATGLDNADISMWFTATGSKVPAIRKVERGVYHFDKTKVKVKS